MLTPSPSQVLPSIDGRLAPSLEHMLLLLASCAAVLGVSLHYVQIEDLSPVDLLLFLFIGGVLTLLMPGQRWMMSPNRSDKGALLVALLMAATYLAVAALQGRALLQLLA